MKELKISQVKGREILDSRGNPTVEVDVLLENGVLGRAAVPSGASTGRFEAWEARDGEPDRYLGRGTRRAAAHVSGEIARALVGHSALEQRELDELLIALDATPNKSRLGANALLGTSLACARAAARSLGLPLYRYIGGCNAHVLPVPMMNILNGGAHAGNNVDIQEFMIVPLSASCFSQALRRCTEVFHALRPVLERHETPAAGVGDEGGYAPMLARDEDALERIVEAIEAAGFTPGRDFGIALDAASSGWFDEKQEVYRLPKAGTVLTRQELIQWWRELARRYPIVSLEDGMAEEDWQGWQLLTRELGQALELVGDDLFVTNPARLARGIDAGVANAVLIKPNQIGTLTETLGAMEMARGAGYKTIVSHRSGETEDTTIAELAVAMNAGQIKTGAPSRTERVAKYNQLLRLEEQLGGSAGYPRRLGERGQ